MREGVLIYDHESGRMDIRFDLLDYYGGLHCGEPLEVKIGDVWVPTTIELGDFWYLKGVYISSLPQADRSEISFVPAASS